MKKKDRQDKPTKSHFSSSICATKPPLRLFKRHRLPSFTLSSPTPPTRPPLPQHQPRTHYRHMSGASRISGTEVFDVFIAEPSHYTIDLALFNRWLRGISCTFSFFSFCLYVCLSQIIFSHLFDFFVILTHPLSRNPPQMRQLLAKGRRASSLNMN